MKNLVNTILNSTKPIYLHTFDNNEYILINRNLITIVDSNTIQINATFPSGDTFQLSFNSKGEYFTTTDDGENVLVPSGRLVSKLPLHLNIYFPTLLMLLGIILFFTCIWLITLENHYFKFGGSVLLILSHITYLSYTCQVYNTWRKSKLFRKV